MFAAIVSDMSRTFAQTESPEIIIDESPDGKTVFSEILSVRGQIRSGKEVEKARMIFTDSLLAQALRKMTDFQQILPIGIASEMMRESLFCRTFSFLRM